MILDEKEYRLLELIDKLKEVSYNKLFEEAFNADIIRAKPLFNKMMKKLEELEVIEKEYEQKGAVRKARIRLSYLGKVLVVVKYIDRYVQVLETTKSLVDAFLKLNPHLAAKISFDKVCEIVLPAFKELFAAAYTSVYLAKISDDAKQVIITELTKQLYSAYKRVLDLFPQCAKKLVEELLVP